MPGTIHVSISELVGLPNQQESSSMGIKVSMGKQVCDAQEKGDFSFVLASLRDKLSVTIHDSEGKEIGHTGVESRSIVEKGMWDDIFPLQGGGYVRMRLHFILTEEEQKRIRSMRESVARKKQEDLLKRSHSSSDLTVASGDSLKASYQPPDGIVNPAGRQPNKISQVHPVQKKQAFFTSKSTGALDKLPNYQRVMKIFQQPNEVQRSQLDKTPSNVRNMIRAFENSPVKEASPATILTRGTSQVSSITTTTNIPSNVPKETTNSVRVKPGLSKLGILGVPISEEKVTERGEIAEEYVPVKSAKNVLFVKPQPSKEIVLEIDEIGENVDLCQYTSCSSTTMTDISTKEPNETVFGTTKPVLTNIGILPTPKSAEIVLERVEVGNFADGVQKTLVENPEQFKVSNEKKLSKEGSQKRIISTKKLDCRLAAFGKSKYSWETLSREIPRNVASSSVMKKQNSTSFDSSVFKKTRRRNPRVFCGSKYYSSHRYHGWIFVEEMIHSCVLSDDRPLIDLLEGGYSDCRRDTTQEKLRDMDVVPHKDHKDSSESRSSSSKERPDRSPPHTRPIPKALRIAIMVGFGVLVLLTRQRK